MECTARCIWEVTDGKALTVGDLRKLIELFSDDMELWAMAAPVKRVIYETDPDGPYLTFR